MDPVLVPDEMRAADEAAIAAGTPSEELMDRAAHACAVTALRMLGGAYGKRVVVVAGKGNNGGDGIICARKLASAGASVRVVNADAWPGSLPPADLVIDAIFGTGFSRAPSGDTAKAIEAINASPAVVLAIDIPSGVNGADASIPGVAVRADVTLAIQSLKVGHLMLPGAERCGRVDLADIGIPVTTVRTFVPRARDVRGVLPDIEADTHKYKVGALAVLAGSTGMTGAAILTARAAIRAGAGLVLLGVPSSTLPVFEATVTEAIKVPLPEIEGRLDDKAVDEMSDRLERCRALAIGPGLGRGPRAIALVRRALDVALPLVIDGDGLWALAEVLEDEPDALRRREHATVLTPHGGEYAFLAGRPAADRVDDARSLAARLRATVHLKGRRAVTASPSGAVWINATGNPGAATGGTGDVLTGIVSSLMAQGMAGVSAMWAGAYLHGLAADVVASRIGERSLSAHDLPEALGSAYRIVARSTHEVGAIRTALEPVV
jgi:NAD(P)H-hydrate epimerase